VLSRLSIGLRTLESIEVRLVSRSDAFYNAPMFTCGWCGVHYPNWQSQCSSCGGDLPPEGDVLGPPPPPTPRTLPRGFSARQWWSANFSVIFGLVFFIVGMAITILFAMAKTWVALFPALFTLGGFSALVRGITQARRTLRAFRLGEATEGEFSSIVKDPMYAGQKGGGAPWIIKYTFKTEGQKCEGTFSTIEDSAQTLIKVGKPVWVLFVKEDPSQSTIYPPLR
jgi:hypothetical protein